MAAFKRQPINWQKFSTKIKDYDSLGKDWKKEKTFLVLITKEMSKEILYIFQKIKTVVWRILDNRFSSFLEGKKKKVEIWFIQGPLEVSSKLRFLQFFSLPIGFYMQKCKLPSKCFFFFFWIIWSSHIF